MKATFTAVTGNKVDKNNGVAFLAWQNEFNRRVLEEVETTGKPVPPQRRAAIINNMAANRITYDVTRRDSSAVVLTPENIVNMADDLADYDEIKRDQEPLFVAAYPTLLSAIGAQRVPVTRERLASTFRQMQSVASTLPEVQRAAFIAGYAGITRSLIAQNSPLTPDNYRTRFEQALARQGK